MRTHVYMAEQEEPIRDSRDAAIIITLAAGGYTVDVLGLFGTSVALLEIHELQ